MPTKHKNYSGLIPLTPGPVCTQAGLLQAGYPTYAEAVKEAALAATEDRALHM